MGARWIMIVILLFLVSTKLYYLLYNILLKIHREEDENHHDINTETTQGPLLIFTCIFFFLYISQTIKNHLYEHQPEWACQYLTTHIIQINTFKSTLYHYRHFFLELSAGFWGWIAFISWILFSRFTNTSLILEITGHSLHS